MEYHLKHGNLKLKNMLVFDLPAGESCINHKDCGKTCYAMKAQRQYPGTRRWRAKNLRLAKTGQLADRIKAQLDRTRKRVVRVHSSGDFFSQEYIDMWKDIAEGHPWIKFYAYTKVKEVFDFSQLEALENFNVIDSMIDGKLNYGDMEYVLDLAEKTGAFLCPATSGEGVKCNDGCNYCVDRDRVVFVKH